MLRFILDSADDEHLLEGLVGRNYRCADAAVSNMPIASIIPTPDYSESKKSRK